MKQRKHEWYVKNREEILKEKQQRWVEKTKAQQLRTKPSPSPEQTARTRQLNRQGYNRYWTSHRGKVRAIDRTYYHRKQDRIVRQQRERRAAKKSSFRKLKVTTSGFSLDDAIVGLVNCGPEQSNKTLVQVLTVFTF